MSHVADRLRDVVRLAVAIAMVTLGAALVIAAPPQPLHERVDALLESAFVGPLPSQSSDAEFLRRVSLDLNGVIPTAAEARAFLDDKSPDKRAKLVDRLLAHPRYIRQMSLVFDVMLMERRPDKVIKSTEWQEYLYKSFAANKPFNELAREILAASEQADDLRPATRFFLARDCEPNVMTRDIGRLFFGMDMQCAQCHDHPLVDDYLIGDYYGLYAFVNRTGLFTDKKTKKVEITEKADGEASYKSVFTGASADRVAPKLPRGGATLIEPVVAKGQEYLPSTDKDAKPIPKFSRRAKLAELVGAGDNPLFNRNIANRLWAYMLGRGIVHPVDFQHPDNPPSNPELLALLADEFRQHKYDIPWMIRELALTRAYQRSCEAPNQAQLKPGAADKQLDKLETDRQKLESSAKQALADAAKLAESLAELRKKSAATSPEAPKLLAAANEAKAAADKAAQEVAALQKEIPDKQQAAKLVADALASAKLAADKIPGDGALGSAAKQLAERSKFFSAELATIQKNLAAKEAAAKKATESHLAAKAAADKAAASGVSPDEIAKLEKAEEAAKLGAGDAKVALAAVDGRINEIKKLVEYQRLAKSDRIAAERLWSSLIDDWTARGLISTLKPLAPEAFALSLMQATGPLAAQEASAAAEIKKTPPKEMIQAPEAERPRIAAILVEKKTFEPIRGTLAPFVTLYADAPGSDFSATINQALFFGNGAVVDGWLKPNNDNLVGRLQKLDDPGALADELYLSVLTRRPSDVEKVEVAAYIKDRKDAARLVAIQEMAWALLSSNEFRFNH